MILSKLSLVLTFPSCNEAECDIKCGGIFRRCDRFNIIRKSTCTCYCSSTTLLSRQRQAPDSTFLQSRQRWGTEVYSEIFLYSLVFSTSFASALLGSVYESNVKYIRSKIVFSRLVDRKVSRGKFYYFLYWMAPKWQNFIFNYNKLM